MDFDASLKDDFIKPVGFQIHFFRFVTQAFNDLFVLNNDDCMLTTGMQMLLGSSQLLSVSIRMLEMYDDE